MQDRTAPHPVPVDDSLGVDLVHAVDDEDDPRSVTVYPRDCDELTTTWLTMDVEHVVDLEAMA